MGSDPRRDGATEARERFFALLEDELADERALGADELRLRDRVGRDDPECRAFLEALDALRRPEPVPPAAIERAVSAQRRAAGEARRRGLVAFGVTVGAVAAAAAIVLVLALGGEPESPAAAPALVFTAEGVAPGGAGHVFTAATAPLLLRSDGDVAVGLERGGALQVRRLDAGAVALRLDKGRVAVHVRPGGKRVFKVITPLCEVAVEGTVFSVEVEPDEVRVGVVRGSVVVSDAERREIARVGAGQQLAVAAGKKGPLASDVADSILALLRMPDAQAGAPVAPLAPAPVAAEAQPAASPRPGIGAAGAGKDAGPGEAARLPGETPADLIRRARAHVKAQRWSDAVAAYRRVASEFPNQPEAVTVRVRLAEIELAHLGSPGTALTDYRHYLTEAPNGPLAEDALFGVCSALRQIGRKDDEARSLAEFLRRFPQSVRAPAADARLKQIGN
jgi:ferric-dicitrate binding protein FerR (iron transport regulator)